MGQFLEKPNTEKHNASGVGPDGIRYGFAAMQGWRVEMEDAHALMPDIEGDRFPGWSFFAIFDGHAGDRVSKHAAQNLWKCIEAHLPARTAGQGEDASGEGITVRTLSDALKNGFLDMDVQLRQLPDIRDGIDKSGSTAVACLITPQWILLANVGDSRAILVKDHQVALATLDHKPSNDKERRRIIEAGGMVIIQRVNGSLAVSRALGDFEYKSDQSRAPQFQLVSPEADVFVSERDVDRDQFVALACDGIWDVMSNEDICETIIDKMKVNKDLSDICNDVLDLCLTKGSKDNMSVIIISFPAAPWRNFHGLKTDSKSKEIKPNTIGDIIETVLPDSSWASGGCCSKPTDNIEQPVIDADVHTCCQENPIVDKPPADDRTDSTARLRLSEAESPSPQSP